MKLKEEMAKPGLPRSGKSQRKVVLFSRSGKSHGILKLVREK